jgi:hypothetical protein
MPRRRLIPAYVGAVDFFKSVGISFELGSKLIVLGVLRADATLNERPIFSADMATYENAKEAVANYRRRQTRALEEVKEVYV